MGIIGKIVLAGIVLMATDSAIHKLARGFVIEKARSGIRNMENFADLFGTDIPVAREINADEFIGGVVYNLTADEKFQDVIARLENPPYLPITLHAEEYARERAYFSYVIRACGNSICPFDPNEIQSDFREAWKHAGRNPVYKPFIPVAAFDRTLFPAPDLSRVQRIDEVSRAINWGVFYGFTLRYRAKYNGNDEIISAEAGIVDYPRNFFGRTLRQLANSTYPYGDYKKIYSENFVLGIEAYADAP